MNWDIHVHSTWTCLYPAGVHVDIGIYMVGIKIQDTFFLKKKEKNERPKNATQAHSTDPVAIYKPSKVLLYNFFFIQSSSVRFPSPHYQLTR